ncbi:MAG: hypothetical protein JNK57_02560 [Planctomycetaceae bacterium]|nr:hypothetical protein [Planctomycetaceae bacterium]
MSNTVDHVADAQKQSSKSIVFVVVIASVVGALLMVGSAILTFYWISQSLSPNFSKMEIEAGQRSKSMRHVQEHIGTFELDNVKYDKKQSDHETFWHRKPLVAFKITGSIGEGYLVFAYDKEYGLGAFDGLLVNSTRYR